MFPTNVFWSGPGFKLYTRNTYSVRALVVNQQTRIRKTRKEWYLERTNWTLPNGKIWDLVNVKDENVPSGTCGVPRAEFCSVLPTIAPTDYDSTMVPVPLADGVKQVRVNVRRTTDRFCK